MIRTGAITYDGLPLSSGGAHTLRQKGFVQTFNSLQGFVNSVSLKPEPSSVILELFDLGNGSYSHFLSLSSQFDNKFPRLRERQTGEYHSHQWTVSADELPSLVIELEKLRPIPNAGFVGRSLVVYVGWNLIFADSNGKPLPFQNRDDHLQFDIDFNRFLGESYVYARISETSTANLFLSLPFEDATDEALELVNRIQNCFPARPSSKHWKKWTITKSRKTYVGRKIPSLI
jgi:hypothetical protein